MIFSGDNAQGGFSVNLAMTQTMVGTTSSKHCPERSVLRFAKANANLGTRVNITTLRIFQYIHNESFSKLLWHSKEEMLVLGTFCSSQDTLDMIIQL
mmetsp:Transcript_18263/g.27599  ORF Transcript_18263/g.27599 Transcript_18263/m.27599 type:complete len:97 (-) Transcript_18263:1776-2066(-)